MSYISSCSICTSDFELREKVTALRCGHAYHTDCIMKWLTDHSTCPVCRQNVSSWDSTFTMTLEGFYDVDQTISSSVPSCLSSSDEVSKLKEIIRFVDFPCPQFFTKFSNICSYQDLLTALFSISRKQNMELESLKRYATRCTEAEEELQRVHKELHTLRGMIALGNKPVYAPSKCSFTKTIFDETRPVKRNRRYNPLKRSIRSRRSF